MRRAIALILGVLVLGVVAGCGSSSDEGEFSASAVRDADIFCTDANRGAAEGILAGYDRPEVKESNSEGEATELESRIFVPVLVEAAERLARDLGSLSVPSDNQEQMDGLIAAYERWADEAKEDPRKTVVAHDTFNEARRLAAEYGFKECAHTPYAATVTEEEHQ